MRNSATVGGGTQLVGATAVAMSAGQMRVIGPQDCANGIVLDPEQRHRHVLRDQDLTMQRNTRYDRQDYSALGLSAGRQPTLGYPLSVVDGKLQRAGQRFYIVGDHISSPDPGARWHSSATRARSTPSWPIGGDGANAVCVMEQDQYGLARPNSKPRAARWAAGTTAWPGRAASRTAGDICYNTDTSGFTRVTRRYYCDVGGASSTGSTGPTGTNATPSSITDNVARWHYLGPAYQSYNEQFWTGNGTAAGFDYFAWTPAGGRAST